MAPDADHLAARPTRLTWSLVIPVKLLAQAKSRLTGIAARGRSAVVLAMAADTIAAAVQADAVAAVLVVTDDPAVSAVADSLGAAVISDEPHAGLNAALAHGAAVSERRWPDRGRAGLAADLPAVTPQELTAALSAAAVLGAAFVPDADGTGTTLYAAAPGVPFRPEFGPSSRDRHLAAGAVEIGACQPAPADITLAGLRRDVDTIEELRLAAKIGLGPRTAALVATGSWL